MSDELSPEGTLEENLVDDYLPDNPLEKHDDLTAVDDLHMDLCSRLDLAESCLKDPADFPNEMVNLALGDVTENKHESSKIDFNDSAFFSTVKPSISSGATSEVIAITTSLGSIRRQFFSSRRTKNFLDCKGICYFLIDANREVSQGANLMDNALLKEWNAKGLLKADEVPQVVNGTSFCIPQVLIDGVPIGNETALQDLEEDGDLEYILVRNLCPACLAQRNPSDSACFQCGVQFMELISEDLVREQSVQRMWCGQLYWD